jgi:hypothetical protein
MAFGRMGLGLGLVHGRGSSGPPAITGIILSNSTVDDDAGVGTLVGHLLMVGGVEPAASWTFDSNPGDLWQIDGNRLEVAGNLSALGGTEEEPAIKVTDALGQEFSVLLPITIAETVAEPENPLPDDGDGIDETGDFDIIPVVQPTSGGTKITGKNSGVAAFLYDVGPPVVGTYTMQVTNDYSGMSKSGREAAVGFGFQDGTDFHMVSLRGAGNNPADMLNSQIYGNFTQANQFTLTNDGAATHGSKDGPNWQQIEILEGGGYTYRTGTGADVDDVTWTDEFTDELPPPLASALDALKFGPSAYYAGNDKGVASHLFNWWGDGEPASFTVTDTFNSTSSGLSLGTLNIGEVHAERMIAIILGWNKTGIPNSSTTSCTVTPTGGEGIGFARAVRGVTGDSTGTCEIWYGVVPTGETAEISFGMNNSQTMNQKTALIVRCIGTGPAPSHSASRTNAGEITVDTTAGGLVLAAAHNRSTGTDPTISGIEELALNVAGDGRTRIGGELSPATGSMVITGSSSNRGVIAVAFAPPA